MKQYDFSSLSSAERGRAVIRMMAAEGVDIVQTLEFMIQEAQQLVIVSQQPGANDSIKKIDVQRHSNGEMKSAVQTVTSKFQEHLSFFNAMTDELNVCYPAP